VFLSRSTILSYPQPTSRTFLYQVSQQHSEFNCYLADGNLEDGKKTRFQYSGAAFLSINTTPHIAHRF